MLWLTSFLALLLDVSVCAYRKALKVVELKDILSSVGIAIPARANKPDLIAKILASPEALSHVNGVDADDALELEQAAKNSISESKPEVTGTTVVDPSVGPTSDVVCRFSGWLFLPRH